MGDLPLYISCIFCFFMAFLFLQSHTTKIQSANHRVTPIMLIRSPINQGCFIKFSFSGPVNSKCMPCKFMLEEISHCHKTLPFLDFVFLGKVHVNEIMIFMYLENELEIRTEGERSLYRTSPPNSKLSF